MSDQTPETNPTPDFTAIQSVADYRAAREQATAPPPEPTPAPEPVAATPAETPEQEADSPKPDPEVSEAARQLRRNRADERKKQIQAEIGELIKVRNQLREEVSRRPDPTPAAPPALNTADSFPSFTQWSERNPQGDYDAYIRAAVADGVERRIAAERAAYQQQTVLQTYAQRADAFKAAHPDYDDVIAQAPASDVMLEAIRESEHAPALAYYLGQHPAEAARLASLPPAAVFKAIGALEVTLTQPAPAPPAPKPITQAPAPITPIGGSANGPVVRDPKEINSLSEWRQRRAEFTGTR